MPPSVSSLYSNVKTDKPTYKSQELGISEGVPNGGTSLTTKDMPTKDTAPPANVQSTSTQPTVITTGQDDYHTQNSYSPIFQN